MKKKWLIALIVVVVLVVTIVTLSFTLFTVQKVEIDLRTSSDNTYVAEEVAEDAGVGFGKNIFVVNKDKLIDNLEKSQPYLKCINIETKFPSTLVFHLAERQPFYLAKTNEGFVSLDQDLKVLERLETEQTGLVYVQNVISATPGDFVELDLLKEFYDAVLLNNRTREEALAMFKSIEYFESLNEVYSNKELGLKLTLNSGREVYLHNAGFGLAYKLAKLYAVLSSIYDLAGQLSDEVIENSEIHINNFIGTNYSEKDCYFYLMFNGEKVTT